MNHRDTESQREPISDKLNCISEQIVDSAYAVHRALGSGLLENVYEVCLVHELVKRGLKVKRQVSLPIVYRDVKLDVDCRIDVVVEDSVVVELKATEHVIPLFKAQLLTYLKLSRLRLGLLINFNVARVVEGIVRVVR